MVISQEEHTRKHLVAPPIKAMLAAVGVGVLVTLVTFGAALGLLVAVPSLQHANAVVIVVAILVDACLLLAVMVSSQK